ncbi:MAG: MgtC/SapB family protein [Acidobacteriota bacterium]
MELQLVFAERLLVAAALGGLIGLEREVAGKAAGLRTNLLICVAAALLTVLSLEIPRGFGLGDPGRIAAQIVTGVGFLGAGAIFNSKRAVHGLTSAATIWVVTAIGMLVGAGLGREAALAAALVLAVLVVLRRVEHWMLGQELVTATFALGGAEIEPAALFKRAGLRRHMLAVQVRGADGGRLTISWRGSPDDVGRLAAALPPADGARIERWEVEE